jgi:hypothetical protein
MKLVALAIVLAALLIVGAVVGVGLMNRPPKANPYDQELCALRGGDYVYQGTWVCLNADF